MSDIPAGPDVPVAGPAAGLATERRWRRRCMVLLVVLLPLTAGVVAYGSIQQWWKGRDLFAREVADGEAVEYGGARWQLHALRMAPLPGDGRIPDNAMGVVADFKVEVLDADLPHKWRGCGILLQDGAGRRWDGSDVLRLRLPRSEARNCVGTMYAGAKVGDTVRVREAFLVPREAAAGVRVVVTLDPQRPYYLRFARPPQQVAP
ncbi:hypothetical protein [Bordetella petrii]|uniref:hypothetical protein n=1 Tax=Bordetella petrii TaxID=94624 RepID=UPI00372E997F